jgi:hypothetical protein
MVEGEPVNTLPQDDPGLEDVRRADLVQRSARLAFVEAVRDANQAGYGYGRIARAIGVTKATVQGICNGRRTAPHGMQHRDPLMDSELEAWREAEWLRAHRD